MSLNAEFESLPAPAVVIKFMIQNPKFEFLPVTSVVKIYVPKPSFESLPIPIGLNKLHCKIW